MTRLLVMVLACAGLAGASPAIAADLCKAVALRDVAAVEAPDAMISKGSTIEAIAQYVIEKGRGLKKFCQHGGYCYPAEVTIDGKKSLALKLTNCRVGQKATEDGDEVFYEVVVDRDKNGAEDLRIDDLDNRLREMGLCSACAGNVATFYVKQPESRCAQLARKALEGNSAATAELQRFPDYCQWQWPGR